MVRLIMGEKGTGKTKKLIEIVNSEAAADSGSRLHRGKGHDDL